MIMVVGIRLGCINHALLTFEAIVRDGVPVAGWVANCVDADMAVLQENIDSLRARLPVPCLGVVPFLADQSPAVVATYFDETELQKIIQ